MHAYVALLNNFDKKESKICIQSHHYISTLNANKMNAYEIIKP